MTWKCKDKKCGRTFPVLARISEPLLRTVSIIPQEKNRVIVEKACCPFCYSIEFEEVKE